MTAQEQSQQDGEGEVQVQESGPDGLEVFLAYLDTKSGRSVWNFGWLFLREEVVANNLLQAQAALTGRLLNSNSTWRGCEWLF